MPNTEFYKNLRKELEEKKKIALELAEAIKFGEETGNVDPASKAALVSAQAQIKTYETALSKRGF